MKRKLLTCLLASMLTIAAFGQTDKDEIKRIFDDYFQTVEQRDNAKTLNYIYPELFYHFPKERMLEAMDKMKADTTTAVTMDDLSVASISETLEIDGVKYAVIKYSFRMTMIIMKVDENSNNDREEDLDSTDFTYEMLKEKYGEKNVNYDREHNTLDVNVTNEMYAINAPAYKEWKFLEKKESMKPMLEKLLPKKVLKKL
jgi:hypothetical protein